MQSSSAPWPSTASSWRSTTYSWPPGLAGPVGSDFSSATRLWISRDRPFLHRKAALARLLRVTERSQLRLSPRPCSWWHGGSGEVTNFAALFRCRGWKPRLQERVAKPGQRAALAHKRALSRLTARTSDVARIERSGCKNERPGVGLALVAPGRPHAAQ